jgi:hypothetical protein
LNKEKTMVTFPRNPNGTFGPQANPHTAIVVAASMLVGALLVKGGEYVWKRWFKK